MDSTALTEMVDRVIAERYRIETLIGVGAISAVFSAYDSVETRFVALKVFDESLALDARFTERLLDAAEQAAQLQHPNIAATYDWGIDGGPFIVSELCEGGCLADLLRTGNRLSASQALVMTLECSRALHYGHGQAMLHTNLKPTNVLFGNDQRVRLGDYGLAKVVSEAPVSHPSRALDSVRYASPEQARGRPVSESTDIYSLALVVDESVSGQAPAVAETVVGTLMARAESPAQTSAALEDLLPVIERCGRIDPSQRPESEELTIALLAAAETMSRPTAFPLAGIGLRESSAPAASEATAAELLTDAGTEFDIDQLGPLDDLDDFAGGGLDNPASDDVTIGLVASEPANDDPDEAGLSPGSVGLTLVPDVDPDSDDILDSDRLVEGAVEIDPVADESPAEPLGTLENLAGADPVFAAVPATAEETPKLDVPATTGARSQNVAYEESEDDAEDQLPLWPLIALVVSVIAAVAAGVYFFMLSGTASSAEVPDLVGLGADEVAAAVADRGWIIERLEDRVDGTTVGSVVAQSPAAGEELSEGSALTVTVSLGNQMVDIPGDLIGLTVEQAASRLVVAGLAVGQISEENSEAFAAGLVVGLDEPTTQKPTGEGVSLLISLGPQARAVPINVVGMTIADATGLLTGIRLQAVEEEAFSPDIEPGIVMAVSPPGGEIVAADSVVTVTVSAGPAPVVMPDIIGLPLDQAIDAIEELGLIWLDTEGTPGEDAIGSLPPIGATVDVGTEVTIILDDPPADDG